MQISYRYQSTDLEIDDWRMWRHDWFSLVIALKICIISRSAKRAIKRLFLIILIKYDKKNICAYNIFNLFSWSMIKKNICACNILFYFHNDCSLSHSKSA
jgi:hypothetical protein